MHSAPVSLDPADGTQPDSFALRTVSTLLFDTLVTTNANGRVEPALATSWRALSRGRWQFVLRDGVKFHDGSALTSEIVATSLRISDPSRNVTVSGSFVIVVADTFERELLAELSLQRNAIVKRNSANGLSGTGPFHIVDWQAGRRLTLAAEENCWRGRPFVDGVEIEFGRGMRDQLTALDLGKADLIEVAPEQARRISIGSHRLAGSLPIELWAIVFTRDASSEQETALREALALSIERGSMRSVLMQGAAQPAGSVLPIWMSGYGFVFPTDADLPRARHLREQVRAIPIWTLAYDGSDGLARLVAERIALNAKDAGLMLQPISNANADARLVRIPLASADPSVSLRAVSATTGLTTPMNDEGSAEELYSAENAMLQSKRVLPLFHLPVSYMSGEKVKGWTVQSDGRVDVSDAWLESGKP
jgi:peptide/nickel transport system substrate-binding protein